MMVDTAVLMIDMQNGYLTQKVRDPLGWPPIWRLHEVIAECAELLAAARAAHYPVIYSRQTLSPAGELAANPRARRHMQSRAHLLPEISDSEQEWSHQIMENLAPAEGDIVLEKTRHSFFAYTELAPVLRGLAVQRVLIAGLQTNVCVEATCRAALEHNFDVAVAEDATTTDGPALHEAALNAMRVLYVEVRPWRELLTQPWDKAYRTPNYGRDPNYWRDPHDHLTHP